MKTHRYFPYWLVLISGPPRSGKSRAGSCLAEELSADHFALSNLLKRLTHEHFGLGSDIPPMQFEDCKDQPIEQFGGLTPRDAYILFSETIMKKSWGEDYLGREGQERVMNNQASGTISIVSGVGFIDEVRPLIDEIGGAQTLHIEILPKDEFMREDSREHLRLNHLGVTEVKIKNRNCKDFLTAVWQIVPRVTNADLATENSGQKEE